MTKASKARKAFVDNDDVVVSLSPLAPSMALTLIHDDQTGPIQIDDAFLAKYRNSIRAKFNAGAKFVDLIATLNLTPDDKDAIEKLRVVFYETWQECIFEKRGATEAKARKMREARQETKRADWTEEDTRDYGATKTAWVDVRERAGLKTAPVKTDNANKGQGKAKGEDDAKEAVKLDNFDAIHQEILDVARYLDAIVAQGAKIKCAGLLQHVADCARGLRVAAHASKLEMDADKAAK
jgi:hypothetical protein